MALQAPVVPMLAVPLAAVLTISREAANLVPVAKKSSRIKSSGLLTPNLYEIGVVVTTGGASMVMVSVSSSNRPFKSVTFSATVKVPFVVGVPVIAPVVALSDNPAGKPVAVHPLLARALVPMVTVFAIVAATPLFRVLLNGAVVIVGPEFTTKVSSFVAISPSTSTNLTVKVKVPVAVGLPVISPVFGFRASPAGSAPDSSDQAPVAAIAALPLVFVCAIGVMVTPETTGASGVTVVIVGFVTTLITMVSSSAKPLTSTTRSTTL